MQFLNPIWLWGLTALVVPIAIHLLSRKEGKTIRIGSIRFLKDAPTARFRHVRLNELLLLALRALIIILIVLLLADPVMLSNEHKPRKWIVVENGVIAYGNWRTIIQDAIDRGFSLRELAPGFPERDIDQQETGRDQVHYWSLAEKLRDEGLDSAVVVSHNYLGNFRGQRVPLPPSIVWMSAEVEDAQEGIAQATRLSQDSVLLRHVSFSSDATKYTSSIQRPSTIADTITIMPQDSIRIGIYFDPKYAVDAAVIQSALGAIQSTTAVALTIKVAGSERIEPGDDWAFWLSDKPVTRMESTFSLLACPSTSAIVLHWSRARHVCANAGSEWIITQRLNQDIALSNDLPIRLAEVILPHVGAEGDKRTLDSTLAFSKGISIESLAERRPLAPIEWVLVMLVGCAVITERIVAFKRGQ